MPLGGVIWVVAGRAVYAGAESGVDADGVDGVAGGFDADVGNAVLVDPGVLGSVGGRPPPAAAEAALTAAVPVLMAALMPFGRKGMLVY